MKTWTRWPRQDRAVCSLLAWRSMPPGVVPIGHFLEKTAILRTTGGAPLPSSSRRFQANSAPRRSPVQGLTWEEKVLEMEVEGAWRRRRAGMVKRAMKKRILVRLVWGGRKPLLGLVLEAILVLESSIAIYKGSIDALEKTKFSRV